MSSFYSSRSPQVGLAGRITPGIKWLIIANVAVFILQVLAISHGGRGIESIFGLTPRLVFDSLWLWQPVTYMFLHTTDWLGHLLLNMFMLWMFGTEIERIWGTREFVKYYFLCGIGAGLMTCLIFPDSTTIGASGAVFGVMLAYALLFPNRQILFWFIFPMRALSFMLLCAGIEMYLLFRLQDGIAHLAHLGGMLFGYLYLKRVWRLRQFWNDLRWKLRRRRFRIMQRRDDENYPYH
ncbi:MAG TPA: rhomboid family intramembrane serine protease [Candidatus Polarisedimenticolia bacterium]|nr:rhomboid family intramembrane serine protease [Candidatus Polarisedimenticolia bacterium]